MKRHNPLSVSTKRKKAFDFRQTLDINNHLLKKKTKFSDLDGNKGYLFQFDLKSMYHHVNIVENHKTYFGFSWKLIRKRIILSLLS